MKKLPLIVLSFFLTALTFMGGYFIALSKPRPLEQVIVDGDEMPGIGADKVKPDTCIAYLDSNKIVHLQYAK